MIEVKNVTKRFDDFVAISDLSLAVPRGSIYGLVGPNGSGKSTIIRHITGVYKPDRGDITIGGKPIFDNVAVKAKMAYIPDDIFYFTQSSIRDMMNFYAGVYPSFSRERFERLREAFNLPERKSIRRMSKGMQKQAAFWLSMSMCPEVLVLDEPVDGLDPVMRRQIWSIIMADVAEHGTTVLVSSHNLRELEDVCDHVGILDRGKLLLERSLGDLQENLVKVQLALPDDAALPDGLEVINSSAQGRLCTLIVRGQAQEVSAMLSAASPLFMDVLPLTLEEIFIYELGGADYAIKNIVL